MLNIAMVQMAAILALVCKLENTPIHIAANVERNRISSTRATRSQCLGRGCGMWTSGNVNIKWSPRLYLVAAEKVPQVRDKI